MKTYKETLHRAAESMLSMYLGGSNDYRINSRWIAYIYELPVETVDKDIEKEFKTHQDTYYKKLKK